MHRRLLAVAAGTAAAIVLTACGGSGKDSGQGPSGPAPSVSADARLHNLLPPDVRDKGKLVMATDATIGAPFASFGSDNKTVVGLNVEMAKAIGQVLGIDVEVTNTPFSTFIPGLQAKRYDFSVSVMLDTKERQKVVDFVDYIKDGSGFLVRAGDSHDNLTLANLCGMKAGAISGSVEQGYLGEQSKKCTAAGQRPIAISIFAGSAQGILALNSRRVDVWVGDSDQNAWLKQQNNGALTQSGQPFNAAIDGIAILKGSPLVTPIQKAVQALMDNGTYGRILSRYGVKGGAISKATLNNDQF